MKLRFTLCLVLFSASFLKAQTITPDANGIVYIDAQGSGNKTGSSWLNAAEIRPAFNSAKTNTAIQQLWIKTGNYLPTTDNDRQKYLEITRNIKVYGGFIGTETSISGRNLQANITTISGNIGNVASSGDNSYHLLVIWPKNEAVINNQTVIDGIIFKDANANSGSVINQELPLYMGAAIFACIQDFDQKNYPIISNCKFLDNYANQGGAAIYYDGMLASAEQIKIQDCVFENNISSYVGGALFFFYDADYLDPLNQNLNYYNVEVANCTFKNNKVNNNAQGRGAESSGGAICALGKGNLVVRNSTFQENTSEITFTAHGYQTYGNGSGLAAVRNADVKVYNSLFYNNNKAAIFNREANLKLINSTLHHTANELVSLSQAKSFEMHNSILWNEAVNTPALLLPDIQPTIAIINNSIFNSTPAIVLTSSANNSSQNPLFVATNNFTPSSNSLAINAGDISFYTPYSTLANDKDIYGNPRLDGASIDIGAVEYPATLPVDLVDFKASKKLNGVQLAWRTLSETNNKGFNILKSSDGISFKPVAHVSAKGPANYNWWDEKPFAGKNYYELQQVDLDGTAKIVGYGTVNFEMSTNAVYPNPTRDVVNIRLDGNTYQAAKLFDVSGRLLSNSTIDNNASIVSIDLSKLSSGVYFVKLLGTESKSFRVVKQ
ncbi:hypothetical protein D3C87_106290 [compost metagenome]